MTIQFLANFALRHEVQAPNICYKGTLKENENGHTCRQPSDHHINPPCCYEKACIRYIAYIRYSTTWEIEVFTQTVAHCTQEKLLESRKRCESFMVHSAKCAIGHL